VTVRQGTPRKIRVEFKAPHAGTFHADLRITFSDKTRTVDQEWIVTRELRGHAILPASSGPAMEEMGEDDGHRIRVFPYFALEFSADYRLADESFATQRKDLIITKTSATPLVSFIAATVYSPDASMTQ
jgi:hypothetical protein